MSELEMRVLDNPAIEDLRQTIVDAANKAFALGLPPDAISSILATTAANGAVKRHGEAGAKAMCDIIMQYWHNVRTGVTVLPGGEDGGRGAGGGEA